MKTAVLIDGGHLRVAARKDGQDYDPEFVRVFSYGLTADREVMFRVLYYDCAPYRGSVPLPISGNRHEFNASDAWLKEIAGFDLFAVRRGDLKFRGFKPKRRAQRGSEGRPLTDQDFKPDFEQKGVDMRIGLDMASFAYERSVERIILVSADTDCIPAMKLVRKAGLQVVLIQLPGAHIAPELTWHADFVRTVGWPLGTSAPAGRAQV